MSFLAFKSSVFMVRFAGILLVVCWLLTLGWSGSVTAASAQISVSPFTSLFQTQQSQTTPRRRLRLGTRREALKLKVRSLPAWSSWFAADLFLGGAYDLLSENAGFVGRFQFGYSLLYESVYNRFALSIGGYGEFQAADGVSFGLYMGFVSQREGLWIQLAAGTNPSEALHLRASIGWSLLGVEVFYKHRGTLIDSESLGISLVLRAPLGLLFRHLAVKDLPIRIR
jgi:hypothetical protein